MVVIPDIELSPCVERAVAKSGYGCRHLLLLIEETAVSPVPWIVRGRTETTPENHW